MHDLCWVFCQHFQGYKSFYNPACDSELESPGVLLCSVLLSFPLPLLFVPTLVSPFKLSRHGLGVRGEQRGYLHSLAVLRPVSDGTSSDASAALRYLCLREMWPRALGWFYSYGSPWKELDYEGKSTGQRIKVLSFSPSPETKGNFFEHQHCATDLWWVENELWIGRDLLRIS